MKPVNNRNVSVVIERNRIPKHRNALSHQPEPGELGVGRSENLGYNQSSKRVIPNFSGMRYRPRR